VGDNDLRVGGRSFACMNAVRKYEVVFGQLQESGAVASQG